MRATRSMAALAIAFGALTVGTAAPALANDGQVSITSTDSRPGKVVKKPGKVVKKPGKTIKKPGGNFEGELDNIIPSKPKPNKPSGGGIFDGFLNGGLLGGCLGAVKTCISMCTGVCSSLFGSLLGGLGLGG